MNEGRSKEISVILRRKLLKFNGGLFADNTVLPVNGTRHKLGAHFTPRSYVERLVAHGD
jgi:hypothetical protein